MNLALIPARAGSKRLPGKNMRLIEGRPLFQYTLEAVIRSELFDEIIVSSDDQAVLDFANGYDKVKLHQRPYELATDSATTVDVLLCILNKYGYQKGSCGVFLPTSPFRQAKHIQGAIKLLTATADSIISVCEFEYPPQMAIDAHMEEDHLVLDIPQHSPLANGITQTSSQTKMYRPNGAIYFSRIENFLKRKSFFRGRVIGYKMDAISSLDIDFIYDLEFAQCILKSKNKLLDELHMPLHED
jgi:CMP-N,N'-diacetyllegionaminic acid synthase